MATSDNSIHTQEETNEDRFMNQLSTMRADIQQHYKSLIDSINKREKQLLLELDSLEQSYRQEHLKYKSSIEGLENLRNRTLNEISGNDMTDFRDDIVKRFDEKIKAIRMKIDTQNVSFEWDSHLVNKVSEIGKLVVVHKSVHRSMDYKQKVNPIIKTCKQGTGAGEMNYPWGVATDTNTNNIYVADYSSHRVSVFTSEGEYLFQFNGNTNNTVKMSSPTAVVVYENKVFTSQHTSHYIQVYNVDGTFIQQFGSHGTGKDQFSNPLGLAISSITGDIYVCEFNNKRVQIFSREYMHKAFLGVNQLNTPRDVKLTQQEIFVLDANTPCVHIYNYNNYLLRSIINKTGDGYNINNAYCMCVDTDNNIILSDYGGHCVLVFNSTEDIIHQIGNNTKMFTHPNGVTIDSHGRLIVISQQKDACIQMF